MPTLFIDFKIFGFQDFKTKDKGLADFKTLRFQDLLILRWLRCAADSKPQKTSSYVELPKASNS